MKYYLTFFDADDEPAEDCDRLEYDTLEGAKHAVGLEFGDDGPEPEWKVFKRDNEIDRLELANPVHTRFHAVLIESALHVYGTEDLPRKPE